MMGVKTKIEWCDATWNPVTGCTPVSVGCEKCYAKRLAGRFPRIHSVSENPESFKQIVYHFNRLDIPCHWRKPKRIFVCSMGDLFHLDVSPEFVHDVFDVMLRCPQHTFMVLTKRPENILAKLPPDYGTACGGILPNLWLGVTCENQEMADKRIPILLRIPAAKRFVSVEPMLGPVEIKYALYTHLDKFKNWIIGQGIDWVICGNETGPGKRPFNLDWARSLRDQCVAADVPFFYKPGELDGQLWHQFPGGGMMEKRCGNCKRQWGTNLAGETYCLLLQKYVKKPAIKNCWQPKPRKGKGEK